MVKNKINIYMHAYGLNIEQCSRTYNKFYLTKASLAVVQQ